LRGSGRWGSGLKAIHQVAAYAAEYGLTLGQRACEDKSNEITAIKELLPSLALKGATVTIDAIGCQTEIAQQIIAQGGHYVLTAKDNQPQLAQALREFFASPDALSQRQQSISVHETLDKGHGRIEQRRCTAVGELQWLQDMGLKERWSALSSIGCIQSTRQIGDKQEYDTRYIISSLPPDAPALLHAARTHWGIENGLHWCLDVTFGEDASTIRLRNAAQNFSLLRRIALNLFKGDTASKRSMPKKRKAAAWNHDYLVELLGLRKI
jgi:predicted transposase YbfD/YdcC